MVTVDRRAFSNMLKRIAKVSRTTKQKSPLMGEVIGDTLYIWYSSFDFSVWDEIEVEGAEENFTFSSPIETFSNIVYEWSSETISLGPADNKAIIISSGRSRVTIPYYEGYFDEIENVPDQELLSTTNGILLEFLEISERFAAKTQDKPALTCTRLTFDTLGGIDITACDSFRLFNKSIRTPVVQSAEFLIPSKNMAVAAKLFDIEDVLEFYKADNDYLLITNKKGLWVLLASFNEEYPNVDNLISAKDSELFKFKKDNFEEILKVGGLLTQDDSLKFSQLDDSIFVSFSRSVSDSELFLEGAEIVEGIEDSIKLNINFLKECIDALSSDTELSFRKTDTGHIRILGDDPTISTMTNRLK